MEDIQLLHRPFPKLYAENTAADRRCLTVGYQRLFAHLWPGNVRELQNVLERAVLLAKGDRVEPVDLPFDNGSASAAAPALAWDVPPNMTLEDIEKICDRAHPATEPAEINRKPRTCLAFIATSLQQDQEI